jgi:hypothetical protein
MHMMENCHVLFINCLSLNLCANDDAPGQLSQQNIMLHMLGDIQNQYIAGSL